MMQNSVDVAIEYSGIHIDIYICICVCMYLCIYMYVCTKKKKKRINILSIQFLLLKTYRLTYMNM
jgi:hypothetical protein